MHQYYRWPYECDHLHHLWLVFLQYHLYELVYNLQLSAKYHVCLQILPKHLHYDRDHLDYQKLNLHRERDSVNYECEI